MHSCTMSADDGGRGPIPLGPIGRNVIANLASLRDARKLTYKELSDRLAELGRPIPTLGLSRIERGTRRVDADDLVALALALGVNPSALLLPRDVERSAPIELTSKLAEQAGDAWAWADGRAAFPAAGPYTRSSADWVAHADFAHHARPSWAPLPAALQALQAEGHDAAEED
jgi:transcriptional regulator with XRE-family HTH domain